MRHNQTKHFGYHNFNQNSGGSSKRWLIIGIAIAVAVLLIVGGIILAVTLKNKNQQSGQEGNTNVKQMTGIEILHAPQKTVYYCGEAFDVTGLTVYAYMSDGSFPQVDLRECTVEGFDSSIAVQSQTLTVTYKGFKDTFEVTIKAPLSETPVLVKIEMENLPKTQYKVGEALNIDGGTFIATYSDGTTKTIKLANKHIYGFRDAYNAGVGEYDITVKYSKDGVEVQTTYKITITE